MNTISKPKILLALTQTNHYLEHPEIPTGIWLEEAVSFYDEMNKAGYEVVFGSAAGGKVPVDQRSLQADATTLAIAASDGFKAGMENSVSFADIHVEEFVAVYYCGGHGAMWDFPKDKNLKKISETIYANGGYITSVCHGEAGLISLQDENGEPLVKGKKINGFTNEEEGDASLLLPYSPEDEIKKLGANFVNGAPFTEFAVVDQHFVTGQNPMSSRKVARLLLEELAK